MRLAELRRASRQAVCRRRRRIGRRSTGSRSRRRAQAKPRRSAARGRGARAEFPNPLGLAAGFDKNAEVPGAMLRLGFGFVEVGTLTPRPQPGNPRPRLFRLREDGAVINRFGFNNEGYEKALARLARRPAGLIGVNVGANKDAADRIADYVARRQNLRRRRRLSGDQRLLAQHARPARSAAARGARRARRARGRRARRERAAPAAARQDRARSRRPRARRHRRGRARAALDGLIVSNTTVARPASLRSRHRGEAGGLSGRPLFEPSTRLLARAYLRARRRDRR